MTSAVHSIGALLSQSIPRGGFFDKHPILVPASLFSLCWIPYVIIFFRKSIAFGDVGTYFLSDGFAYWFLLAIQLTVCVVSHSLTIRTIVRLYAPRWLIWGSVAFYCLSPAWGLLTAADIRHPLFAAVFCVFTSSLVFALYSRHSKPWLWIQLGGGALCVCLLRAEGALCVIPTLILLVFWKIYENRTCKGIDEISVASHSKLKQTKKHEALWSDVWAAFLVVSGVSLFDIFSVWAGYGLPLGQPSFGAIEMSNPTQIQHLSALALPFEANLTGSNDIAGILPYEEILSNSMLTGAASTVAQFFYQQQCFPLVNLTFSYIAYMLLFAGFFIYALVFAVQKHGNKPAAMNKNSFVFVHDVRPFLAGLSMAIIIGIMFFIPGDDTLRYIMPILAAQPMMFGSCLKGIGTWL